MEHRHVKLWAPALALALAVGSAAGFEMSEHEQLGDLAWHLSVQRHCLDVRDCVAVRDAFYDPLAPQAGDPNRVSYGRVVRCVDAYLTPEKLIARREIRLIGDQPAPRNGVLPDGRQQFANDLAIACTDDLRNLQATQAAHSNHAHFQAELVASQNLYHRLAIGLARDGRLFSALFMNAVSDHYLHDFFAPGHIGTFRSHMSDIYANAMHDSINHSGATLSIDAGALDDLLESLRQSDPELSEVVRRRLRCVPTPGLSDRVLRPPAADVCVDDAPDRHEDWTRPYRTLGELLRAELPRGLQKHAQQIELRGDNQLWRPSQRRQLLLMLALQLRSIREVLEPPADTRGQWFDQGAWSSARGGPGQEAVLAATLDGRMHYRMTIPPPLRLTEAALAQPDLAAGAALPEVTVPRSNVIGIGELNDDTVRLKPTGLHEAVLSLGLNYEMPHFGRMQNRVSVSFEAPLLAYLNIGDTKVNFGVAAGAFTFREDRGWHAGLSLRPGLVLTQSETFVSLPLRAFRYRAEDGRPLWRSSFGLRVEQGFSSFATVHLQYSRSPFQQGPDEIARGSVLGVGVVLAAPLCRVPWVSGWLCRRRRFKHLAARTRPACRRHRRRRTVPSAAPGTGAPVHRPG